MPPINSEKKKKKNNDYDQLNTIYVHIKYVRTCKLDTKIKFIFLFIIRYCRISFDHSDDRYVMINLIIMTEYNWNLNLKNTVAYESFDNN